MNPVILVCLAVAAIIVVAAVVILGLTLSSKRNPRTR
jgi:hypothetical protein